jgi:uncharacterized protein
MSSPKYWREMPQRYRFEAKKCIKCDKVMFPPRIVCPACGSRNFADAPLNDHGQVETFTVIRVAPSGFGDQVPYAVAIVNLGDGVKILCQIADIEPDELKIGLPVRLEFRKIQQEGHDGIICYGYKGVPQLK